MFGLRDRVIRKKLRAKVAQLTEQLDAAKAQRRALEERRAQLEARMAELTALLPVETD